MKDIILENKHSTCNVYILYIAILLNWQD